MSEPFRVLVVDDSPLQAALLRHLLTRHFGDRITVDSVTTAEGALERVPEEVDLLLVDWQMPGMNGDQLVRKALGKGLDCKRIIISSAHPAKVLHDTFDDLGCLAVIEKGEPAQEEAFLMIVDGLLRRRQREADRS
jgi:CheY-like chemotaxis protein